MDALEPDLRATEALRATIHRVNNFLSVVTVRAETALARNDAELSRRALEAIVAQSRVLGQFLREARRRALGE